MQQKDDSFIRIRGACEHNLKHVDADVPLGALTVVTGPSGSGKTSLAMSTLYAEGQRRYVETFSPYVRQFMDRMDRPQVDAVENVPPAIALGQRNSVKNSRSTVGTMTGINEYLKLVFSRLAVGRDAEGHVVHPATAQGLAEDLLRDALGREVLVAFEVKVVGGFEEMRRALEAQGYLRVLAVGDRTAEKGPREGGPREGECAADVSAEPEASEPPSGDGGREESSPWEGRLPEVLRLSEATEDRLDAERWLLLQDRVKLLPENRSRLMEALETSLRLGLSRVFLSLRGEDGSWGPLRLHRSDWYPLLEPRPELFSSNSPLGACPECKGYGRAISYDYMRGIIPEKSIRDGALRMLSSATLSECFRDFVAANKRSRAVRMEVPWVDLTQKERDWVFYGNAGDCDPWEAEARGLWYGYKGIFDDMEKHAHKMSVRVFLAYYRVYSVCPACGGGRLRPEALAFTVGNLSVPEVQALPMEELLAWVDAHVLPRVGADRSLQQAVRELRSRVAYLCEVGLGYLSASRLTRSLSGGEVERVSLTACLGAALTETLFVLDEPTVGLHARDTARLIRAMRRLTDRGNTLVVVEHEESVMRAADAVIDMGPASGSAGGQVVYAGDPAGLLKVPESLTGGYLSGRLRIEPPAQRRRPSGFLRIRGAECHNLHDFDVDLPLGVYCCLTGVSGSGKSTLACQVLYGRVHPDALDDEERVSLRSLEGLEALDDVLLVDQSPIVRTPRSTPAVYIGVFEDIRALFAAEPAAQARGLKPGYFSFNSGEGRCPRCAGLGQEKVEMQFLSDIFVPCALCHGQRYTPQALSIRLLGSNMAEMLAMDVASALRLFAAEKGARARRIASRLRVLVEVGLGHLGLGQGLNTLSGGENQRLKLARILVESLAGESRGKGKLLILDEPGTGLHFSDLEVLLGVFRRLVDQGNSLLVIEHNLDLIKCADQVIDLGPEGGSGGGRIVAQGTPEEVAACPQGHTARYLRAALAGQVLSEAPVEVLPEDAESLRGVIALRGARHHQLKNIDVDIPRREMTVVTGLSGSGKSTLAFDIIFAEGQKRFLDVMSPYARQFTEQMETPDIDRLTGLPPTVAIEQNRTRGGSKSTVGTVTEIWQYLRLLYAKLGTPHCPKCGVPLGRRSREEINRLVSQELEKRPRRLLIAAPVVRNRKGHYADLARWAARRKYPWLRADGRLVAPDDFTPLDRYANHDVDVVLADVRVEGNRVSCNGGDCDYAGLLELVGHALEMGDGYLRLSVTPREGAEGAEGAEGKRAASESASPRRRRSARAASARGKEAVASGRAESAEVAVAAEGTEATVAGAEYHCLIGTRLSCPECGTSYPDPEPSTFSFNSPHGWCPCCLGHGHVSAASTRERQGDDKLSHLELELRYDRDVEKADEKAEDKGEAVRVCPACGGARLNPFALAVQLFGRNIAEIGALDAASALKLVQSWHFEDRDAEIARNVVAEIEPRLRFLQSVGLGYLSLDRAATTLSGGESQRIRLAAQLGSELRGVLYVLDEPTIGLHPRDNERLLGTLRDLRDRGNTLLVVEHDEETMRCADHLIDLGPGAGVHGGEVVAEGSFDEILANPASVTGQALRHREKHPFCGPWLPLEGADWLEVTGCRLHNLRDVTLRVPRGRLTVVTGPSGAGKTSLITGTLAAAVRQALGGSVSREERASWDEAKGLESIRALYRVDQSPLGKTPRSTPATYIGIFDEIRALFARTADARRLGFAANRFSFNTAAGHCETCKGTGYVRREMDFLPPCTVPCETCRGARYNSRTLQVRYKGKTIAEVLDMNMEEAAAFFAGQPRLSDPLELLCETGLGYLTLGQASNTLSGGEAQRIKLVTELIRGRRAVQLAIRRGRALPQDLYLIEEPTIGLHPNDVRLLVKVLRRLVEMGNTVVVIEHNLELICEADYIIDLGPGPGAEGGRIVASGSVREVSRSRLSPTAPFIRAELRSRPS